MKGKTRQRKMVLTPKRLTSPHCRKGCSGIFTYLVKIKYRKKEKDKTFQVIQGMASCMFSCCLLIWMEREASGWVPPVLSCQDAVSLGAAGHQLRRRDCIGNTVRRLGKQSCILVTLYQNRGTKKDQKTTEWSSATGTHQRR